MSKNQLISKITICFTYRENTVKIDVIVLQSSKKDEYRVFKNDDIAVMDQSKT